MGTLSGAFNKARDTGSSVKSLFDASLQLVFADTRRGISPKVQSALNVVRSFADAASPHRTKYADHYEAAAGLATRRSSAPAPAM